MTKITENEREVLTAILDSDFNDDHEANHWVWSFSANPWAYDGSKETTKFAGVLVSLMKKGLAKQSGTGRDACVAITEAGVEALK